MTFLHHFSEIYVIISNSSLDYTKLHSVLKFEIYSLVTFSTVECTQNGYSNLKFQRSVTGTQFYTLIQIKFLNSPFLKTTITLTLVWRTHAYYQLNSGGALVHSGHLVHNCIRAVRRGCTHAIMD